jgi:hypothetical protein
MPIVIQDQKLTLLGEITGECDTAEQLFQKAAKKIESKTRLTNLMSPTYVHLENFLSKINQHSVHYASKIADKLKEIGYSDDQIEEVAIKHLREDSAKPLFNRYDKITGFLEQFVYQSHCFYFGNHVVHMCVSRFNSRNTHITVASSLDEWKEKLEILFHQMISEQLATVTFES